LQKIRANPSAANLGAEEVEMEARSDKAARQAEKEAHRPNPPPSPEDEVMELLGNLFPEGLPLLVPCVKGTKKPVVKWGKLTEKSCEEDEGYWSALKRAIQEGGNLAVKVRPASRNLCVIDFDDDALVKPFLELNPAFNATLCTRGSKGCSFWFYVVDEYPQEVRRIHVLDRSDGTGEWRGGKGISILWGVHPKGMEYQRLNETPPRKIAFAEIKWPKGWKLEKAERKFVKIDWDRFNEMLENEDGDVVQLLVEKYFEGAVWNENEKRWRCANIGGDPPTDEGSFTIRRNGRCNEWDGDWPGREGEGIVKVICSEARAKLTGEEWITEEEVFTFLKEGGEDFFTPDRPAKKKKKEKEEPEPFHIAGNDYNIRRTAKGDWYLQKETRDGVRWLKATRDDVRQHLGAVYGLSTDELEDQILSEADKAMHDAFSRFSVEFAGEYAGYREPGEIVVGNDRLLITRGVKLIEPVKGNCEFLKKCLRRTFVRFHALKEKERETEIYQFDAVFGWIQGAVRTLYGPSPVSGVTGRR
jgi:hypothetical protein